MAGKSRLLSRFDPEGEDYDYDTAKATGMGPAGDEAGENKGHWGSVAPASPADREKHKLPKESYIMLKGRKHKTWDLGVRGEEKRGFTVKKYGNRYYSVPRQ